MSRDQIMDRAREMMRSAVRIQDARTAVTIAARAVFDQAKLISHSPSFSRSERYAVLMRELGRTLDALDDAVRDAQPPILPPTGAPAALAAPLLQSSNDPTK